MKNFLLGMFIIGAICVFMWVLISGGNRYDEAYSKAHPPKFYVSCSEDDCAVIHRPIWGDRSVVTKNLTPTQAEKLTKELNEKVQEEKAGQNTDGKGQSPSRGWKP